VLDHGNGGTRFVSTADFLPGDVAERIDAMMARGIRVIGETLAP